MAGSLGYAERLSWRDDLGGQLGDPELAETSVEVVSTKVDELAELIRESKASGGMVVHTGAGISTASGIRDYATKGRSVGAAGLSPLEAPPLDTAPVAAAAAASAAAQPMDTDDHGGDNASDHDADGSDDDTEMTAA